METAYSSSIRGWSTETWSMGWTCMALMTPDTPAEMLCSIFIASTTQTSWSGETDSPGRTVMDSTFPGMGDRMTLSEPAPREGGAAGGGAG